MWLGCVLSLPSQIDPSGRAATNEWKRHELGYRWGWGIGILPVMFTPSRPHRRVIEMPFTQIMAPDFRGSRADTHFCVLCPGLSFNPSHTIGHILNAYVVSQWWCSVSRAPDQHVVRNKSQPAKQHWCPQSRWSRQIIMEKMGWGPSPLKSPPPPPPLKPRSQNKSTHASFHQNTRNIRVHPSPPSPDAQGKYLKCVVSDLNSFVLFAVLVKTSAMESCSGVGSAFATILPLCTQEAGSIVCLRSTKISIPIFFK